MGSDIGKPCIEEEIGISFLVQLQAEIKVGGDSGFLPFHVITGRKPRQQKVSVLFRKAKILMINLVKVEGKCDSGTHQLLWSDFLGAARLLGGGHRNKERISMCFIGEHDFIAALLMKILCGLLQQIVLDVVSVFKHGLLYIPREVFREYYLTNKEFVTLECAYVEDR
ncbi:hypothetical protein NC652_028662 [Populus alba x Populus x berolinensis]|nr:hypothetical protein NC652_028662 [Populus alba x Populus x berolinensis]